MFDISVHNWQNVHKFSLYYNIYRIIIYTIIYIVYTFDISVHNWQNDHKFSLYYIYIAIIVYTIVYTFIIYIN